MIKIFILISFVSIASCNIVPLAEDIEIDNTKAPSFIIFVKEFFEPFQVEGVCSQSPGNYTKTKLGLENYLICLGDLDKTNKMISFTKLAPSNEHSIALIRNDCPLLQDAVKCTEEFSETLDGCLPKNEINGIQRVLEFFKPMLTYICQNDEKFIELIENEALECLTKVTKENHECSLSLNMIAESSTSEKCREIQEKQECIAEKSKSCEINNLVEFFNDMMELTQLELNCNLNGSDNAEDE